MKSDSIEVRGEENAKQIKQHQLVLGYGANEKLQMKQTKRYRSQSKLTRKTNT